MSDENTELMLFAAACSASALREAADIIRDESCTSYAVQHILGGFDPYSLGVFHGFFTTIACLRAVADGIEQEAESA